MDILLKKAAVQKAFSSIGKKNGSSAPESSSNTFSAAWELFVSKELKSAAEKRYDEAKKTAQEQGVLDMEKAVEGAEVNTYSSEHMDIALKTSASSSTLDKTALKNKLQTVAGMSAAEADKIIAAASKPRKGAVNINISLKG
jgi:hypothetical protein